MIDYKNIEGKMATHPIGSFDAISANSWNNTSVDAQIAGYVEKIKNCVRLVFGMIGKIPGQISSLYGNFKIWVQKNVFSVVSSCAVTLQNFVHMIAENSLFKAAMGNVKKALQESLQYLRTLPLKEKILYSIILPWLLKGALNVLMGLLSQIIVPVVVFSVVMGLLYFVFIRPSNAATK